MFSFKLFLTIALIAATPSSGATEKLYKWQAEDGSVVYSDQPPLTKGYMAKELSMPVPVPIQTVPVREGKSDGLAKQRILQRKQLQQKLTSASEELSRLKEAYEAGKSPREGETQRIAVGRTKLSPAYFDRLKKEELQVELLESTISELRGKLQGLR